MRDGLKIIGVMSVLFGLFLSLLFGGPGVVSILALIAHLIVGH